MDCSIDHPRFRQRRLTMRSSIVGSVALLVDGAEATGKKNVYMVQDDVGSEAEVKLVPNMLGSIGVTLFAGGVFIVLASAVQMFLGR